MPRVSLYQPGQVQRTGTTDAKLAPADSGHEGRALGEGLQLVGRTAGEAAERQMQITELRAEEEARRLDVEHMSGLRPLRERVRSARGIGAREAATTAEAELREYNGEVLARATNPLSRRMLERSIAQRSSQELDSWSTHAVGEEARAIDAGHEARAESFIEAALDHSEEPEIAQANLDGAVHEVEERGRFAGWDPATTGAQVLAVRSRFHVGRARQRFEADDPEGAQSILDQHGDEILAADEAGLRRVISGELQANEADRDAAFVLGPEQPAAGPGDPTPAPAAGAAAPVVAPAGAAGETATLLRRQRMGGRQPSEAVIAGFLGNLQRESGFRTNPGSGDGGTAHGMAQWRAERVANFERVIGKHPSRASRAEQVRFIAWEMNNPQAAGMTVAQRNAILAARTPEQAAELIDRHYERSDGRSTAERSSDARRYYGGSGDLPAADGTRVDVDAAYARISQQPWSESRKRRAREAVQRFAGQNDQVQERVWQDADRAIGSALDSMARSGGRLTSLSQLPAGALANARPGMIDNLQAQIRANNRAETAEANSPLMNTLLVQAAEDPNAFLRVVPEVYRGRVTDAEVQQLTQMQIQIRGRNGPQPSQILSVIRFVLPETSIVPRADPRLTGERARASAQERTAYQRNIEGRLLAATQRRLTQTRGQAEITQADILAAVRAEATQVLVSGQAMPLFVARERGAPATLRVPPAAIPTIDDILRRAGQPITPHNRGQIYLQNRDQIDRALGARVGAGAGSIE